jgi:rhodanese-related sulfurtransferase
MLCPVGERATNCQKARKPSFSRIIELIPLSELPEFKEGHLEEVIDTGKEVAFICEVTCMGCLDRRESWLQD